MPSTDATFVDVTGAVTNIFTAAVANTVVTVRVSAPVLLAGDDALPRFPLRPEDGPLQLTLGIGTDLMASAQAQPGQPTAARVSIFVTEP